jgi:hypothetical protein
MRSFALLLVLASPLQAQQPFDWYGRGPYRAAVPRPDSLLGYALGSRHTMYHQQQQVLDRMMAAAPDRVRTEVIGHTAEGKALRLVIISAPENLARLDAIRGDLNALADPRRTSRAEAAAIASRTPAVALLSHSIHGNEPAGFEAVMQTAWQLLASEEPATLEILRGVVTILNPTMNPDGHERFAAWYNSVGVGADDPAALEQTEPWSVWGRFNHYRFDMNRDVLALSQLETRAVAAAVLRWRPQVFVDLHSTTAQYFFPPPALPVNANLPASSFRWLERFGRGNADAFDRFGWQYFVRDVFDLYYPGYWDSWPALNGATGMTYESDGGPELRLRKADGTVTTFADGIARHFVASLATLETLARGREEKLRDYYEFRASAMTEAAGDRFRRVVFTDEGDPGRALALARLLARHGLEVTRTTAPLTSTTARDYLGGGPARRVFPAGSYVVDIAQPQARLARALLEPTPALDSAFARRQLDRFERNRRRGEASRREGYEFYDVTAWSLALSFGVRAWWTEDTPAVAGEPVTLDTPPPTGGVSGRARSAYVWPGGQEASARLAMSLLGEGFTVGVSTETFRADGATWTRGAYVARVQRNPDAIHERIAALAERAHVRVTAVQSAFPDSGQFGVGSGAVVPLRKPRVLLAAGDGVSQTSFGDVRFYFERELEYPVVPIEVGALNRVDIWDYNVLVLPSGSGSRMVEQLGGADRLKRWVQEGGAIIALGGAVSFLTHRDLALSTVGVVGQPAEGNDARPAPRDTARADTTLSPTAQPGPPLVSPTAPGMGRPEPVPGFIGRATLDRTHWLTLGYERDRIAVPASGTFLTPSRRGDNPVVFVGEQPVLSGFVWPGNTERLMTGSVWAAVENVGRGRVVTFAENPLFRAFWRGTAGLFVNAVLLGPGR